MEYVKNNWLKLLVSAVSLAGLVLTAILLFKGIVKDPNPANPYADDVALSNFFMLMAQMVFFLGLIAYCMLSTFEKTKDKINFVLLAAGIIALVFVILAFVYGWTYIQDTQKAIDSGVLGDITSYVQHSLTSAIFTKVVSLIVFAIFPLLYFVKNLCFKKNSA